MNASPSLRAALIGNPNCGKTALFNRLTGSKQKVANYAGATIERKEGRLTTPQGKQISILDLPGAYSLHPTSQDEAVTRDICQGIYPGEARPDLFICVIDATNLRLHLRFVLELRSLGIPMIVALNMMDSAAKKKIQIDIAQLEAELGVMVIQTIAIKKHGTDALLQALDQWVDQPDIPNKPALLPENMHTETRRILARCVQLPNRPYLLDETLDKWLLHPIFGLAILASIMFFMFQAVYAWATPIMEWIELGVNSLGQLISESMPPGPLNSLLVDGVIAGLGTVIMFLPQILILFACILILEESGYLPRAAFLLDTLMRRAGLSGRSFIPLLSSFACAVPGIMATRSIQHPRDRMTTILVAPLMTCSARLPIYTLLIGAFIPSRPVLNLFNLQGLVLFTLYLAGIVSAIIVAWCMKRWNTHQQEQTLLLELPAYRFPQLTDLAIGLWERAWIFLRRVGGTILMLTVLLWVLLSFPSAPEHATASAITYSFAGQIGQALTWVFHPLGFSWEICVALIPGLAAREVAVSSLATVYSLSASNAEVAAQSLTPLIGQHWSLATAISLLIWYVYAPMCISTLATIRRETHSWKQTGFVAFYLFALAYGAAFLGYQLTSFLTN